MRILLSTLLGLEAFVSQEMQEQGYTKDQIEVQDARVYIRPAEMTMEEVTRVLARANLYSRCAERVYIELIHQEVRDFDTLFEVVSSFPWEDWIVRNSAFHINRGYSRKSDLFGIPAIQGMIKKAIVRRLLLQQGLKENEALEENPAYGHLDLHFSFLNNQFSLCIDTSGEGLHKRGYRIQAGLAPIKETLAAALVYMAKYNPFSDECLYDPFCGSGTILIEAAQMAVHMAPGLKRYFAAEAFPFLSSEVFAEERRLAEEKVQLEGIEEPILFGSDIDESVLEIAKENAKRAGVDSLIRFFPLSVRELNREKIAQVTEHERTLLVCNPPYGERMMQPRDLDILLQALRKNFFTSEGIEKKLRLTLITADLALEGSLGFEADKRRKLYNGMIPCMVYQYFKETGKAINRNTFQPLAVKKIAKKEEEAVLFRRDTSRPSNFSRESGKSLKPRAKKEGYLGRYDEKKTLERRTSRENETSLDTRYSSIEKKKNFGSKFRNRVDFSDNRDSFTREARGEKAEFRKFTKGRQTEKRKNDSLHKLEPRGEDKRGNIGDVRAKKENFTVYKQKENSYEHFLREEKRVRHFSAYEKNEENLGKRVSFGESWGASKARNKKPRNF